ncbi:MAG: hypothetical protein ACOYUK_01580 [Patescibacteria group bacterium]
MKRVYLTLMMVTLLTTGIIFYACSSGGNGDGPTGNDNPPDPSTPAEYFGLVPGRTIQAGYVNYIADSLRQFLLNNTVDAWTFAPVIGNPISYHDATVYPVSAAPIARHYTDPAYTFTLYFSADQTGLYWHGGQYCGLDMPLTQPGRVAPYPLAHGAQWQTIGHAETDIDQCRRAVADTLNATCQRLTGVTVRGTTYPEVFIIRIPFMNVPGHIGTRNYEIWLAPGYGPVRGASFRLPDSATSAYTKPKEGWEFISYSK